MSNDPKHIKVDLSKLRLNTKYVKQEPFVNENGIYIPLEGYVPEGTASAYQCIMTKEMFVEAYNKWIKPMEEVESFCDKFPVDIEDTVSSYKETLEYLKRLDGIK